MTDDAAPQPPAPESFLLERMRLLAVPQALVALVAAALILAGAGALYRSVHGDPFWRTSTDFGTYISAAAAVRNGDTPYNVALYRSKNFYGTSEVYDQYAYPPPFAEALTASRAAVGETATRYIWIAISIASLAASVALLLRGFGARAPWAWVALAFGVVLATKVARSDLYHGQANFLLLFLLTAGLWLYSRGHDAPAGVLWAITFVIKPFFGVLVLWLLWRRAWKAAAVSVATSATVMLLSFAPIGVSSIRGWIDASRYNSDAPFAARPDNEAMHGLLLRLFQANPFTQPWLNSAMLFYALDAAVIVAVIAIFLLVAPRHGGALNQHGAASDSSDPPMLLVESGLLISLAMVYGPLTEGDHFFALLPALTGIIVVAMRAPAAIRMRWLVAATAWCAFFALQAAPIQYRPGVPSESSWFPQSGIHILLTAQDGFALAVVVLVLAWAVHSHRTLQPLDRRT